MFADVIVDIAHPNIDRLYEYAVPEELESRVLPGSRVIVPFGGGNRPKEGFVMDVKPKPTVAPERIKKIVRVIDKDTVLLPEQILLAKKMQEEYGCLLVEALRLMIPAQMRGGRVKSKSVLMAKLAVTREEAEAAIEGMRSKAGTIKAPAQAEALRMLMPGWDVKISEMSKHVPGGAAAVRRLEEKGLVEIFEAESIRTPYKDVVLDIKTHELTEDQQNAVSVLCKKLGSGETFLLHGVTGSGKTEVYMALIDKCLERGEGAIVLVPEISLTPQAIERFRGRFGDNTALLHSRLSAGERFDEWRRIRRGEARVVIGARSAVFAPVNNLGLIVIDEEHESSYRSDAHPRYNAAAVASMRLRGGLLLLGSATPSIETYFKCRRGAYGLVELPCRVNSLPMPKTEVIDMRDEIKSGNRSIFSAALYTSLLDTIRSGRQAMLFLNRRGYATFVMCRGCGYVMRCGQCDVSMTYHLSAARCHYCGEESEVPGVCPECSKPYLKHFGIGTQQVEEQVLEAFPGTRVIRMDFDTTQKKDAHLDLLGRFGAGEAQVLVGTQMIAKGLDFHDVNLVGVIAADNMLYLPDYRSAERTFQLITQVAGRAGRADAGKVIVQTFSPEHYAVSCAARQDYEAFYEKELALRRKAIFPPFALFIRALATSENIISAQKAAFEMRRVAEGIISAYAPDKLLYIGESPAPVSRIKGRHRAQALIKLKDSVASRKAAAELMKAIKDMSAEDALCDLEINPNNML
ncbi:MAG: replication restart helicase PriA [Christensenellales bacterium]|jgi:primosomal protein N' (replication factor Y)